MRHISNSHTSSEQPDKVSHLDVKKTLRNLAVFKTCHNFTKRISRENLTHATHNNNYHSNTRSSPLLGYFPSGFRPVGLGYIDCYYRQPFITGSCLCRHINRKLGIPGSLLLVTRPYLLCLKSNFRPTSNVDEREVRHHLLPNMRITYTWQINPFSSVFHRRALKVGLISPIGIIVCVDYVCCGLVCVQPIVLWPPC